MAADRGTRLRRGGLTGLIGGEEKRRSKLIGSVVAGLLFLASIPTVGVIAGLAAVVVYSALSGLVLRIRKQRAGVPLDSADY